MSSNSAASRASRFRSRGQALIYVGIFALVFCGLAALAIDAGRLFLVNRENQAVADASALAGATALARGGGDAGAVQAAKDVALLNSVDSNFAVVGSSDITVGRWSGGTFTTGTPHNAVKTNPHFTVYDIFPLWSATSTTRREAIAAFATLGQSTPSFPVVVGSCFHCDPSDCPTTPINLAFSTSNGTTGTGDNAAWAVYPPNTGTTNILSYISTACGGGGQIAPTEHVGDYASMSNGVANTLCSTMDSFSATCIGTYYIIPVVSAPCYGPLNQSSPITGFTLVTVEDINCGSPGYCQSIAGCSGPTVGCACNGDNDCPGKVKGSCITKYITLQPTFVDCSLPQFSAVCQGGNFGNGCTDCGAGAVVLVE
jgi:Flp pilus assembly protein TadG